MLTSFPNFLNKGEKIDMSELLKRIVTTKRKVIAFPIYKYWIDNGRQENLQEAYTSWKKIIWKLG